MSERYKSLNGKQEVKTSGARKYVPLLRQGARAEFSTREDEMRLGQQMDAGKQLIQKAQLTLKERGDFLTDQQRVLIQKEITAGERQRIEARNELVTSHMQVARIMSIKYGKDTIEREDLFQDATEALVKAADRYDWTKGFRFRTYAQRVVSGALQNVLRDNNYRPMHMPRELKDNYSAVVKASEKLTHDLLREPTNIEIGKEVHKSPDEVGLIFQAMRAEKAINKFDNDQDDSNEAYQIHDKNADTEETIIEAIIAKEKNALIQSILAAPNAKNGMDDRMKKIIKLRYFEGMKQSDVGKEIGCSQIHVSRLERRALERMKNLLGPQDSE